MADRLAADPAGIARAADLLRSGELVAFPTDTVYGIGCRAGDATALARIFAAKRRDPEKAVAWLVASRDEVTASAFRLDDRALELAGQFWPGGLTLVLAAIDGPATQAFRVPAHDVALAVLAAAGPLAVSSANRSGEPETLDADDVAIAFADAEEPSAILDGGRVPGGVASSVLDLARPAARLLREGAVSRAEIEQVIGPID
ncbi:MAG: threonylcarbamoyl-AMP synthase [Chloroflexi bacterium]|nr:threonylcarbamoyl-AMP synthase [Chloroflexota bacterium]